jgi:4-amino-4-deoxy-L-arabinose transferase-like glycosyltransferase
MNSISPRLRAWMPLAVCAYGILVACAFAFVFYRRQGLLDPAINLNAFGTIARHIAHGDGFSQGHGATMRRAPLYPGLGGALLAILGRDGPGLSQLEIYWPIIAANCIIFGGTCVVVWRLATRIFGSRTGLLAAAACPWFPQSLRYVGMTEVETLMGLCIALLAATGVALATRPGVRSGAAFGAVAAAATLAKPIVLLYPFFFIACAAWHWRRTSARPPAALAGTGAALLCLGVLLAPWSLRNMAVSGGTFKGISSNGPGEFLRGYVNAQPKYYLLHQDFGGSGPGEKWDPEANAYEEKLLKPYGIPFYWAVRGTDDETTPPHPAVSDAILEVQKDRAETAEVKRQVARHPAAFVRKFLVQLFTFWYVVETRKKSLLVGAIAAAVLALSAVGWMRARRQHEVVWPIVAVIVYFNAMYAVFLAFARYSMPLFPTLAILAAGGATDLAERLISRRRVPSVSAAAPPAHGGQVRA